MCIRDTHSLWTGRTGHSMERYRSRASPKTTLLMSPFLQCKARKRKKVSMIQAPDHRFSGRLSFCLSSRSTLHTCDSRQASRRFRNPCSIGWRPCYSDIPSACEMADIAQPGSNTGVYSQIYLYLHPFNLTSFTNVAT